VSLIESNLAMISALRATVPGFNDAYDANLASQELSVNVQPFRDRLAAMAEGLEKLRQILKVGRDGKPLPVVRKK